MPRLTASPEQRFWARVDKQSPRECWLWLGNVDRGGYGWLSVDGSKVKVHRFSYELLRGPIPGGLHLDHLCRVRNCVNPYHLEPVTGRQNAQRGADARTHCKNGHAYEPHNTYWTVDESNHGHRQCIICRREAEARRPPRSHKKKDPQPIE